MYLSLYEFVLFRTDSKTDKSLMTYRGHFNKRNYDMLLEAKFSPVETGQRYIYTGTTSGHLFGKSDAILWFF